MRGATCKPTNEEVLALKEGVPVVDLSRLVYSKLSSIIYNRDLIDVDAQVVEINKEKSFAAAYVLDASDKDRVLKIKSVVA